jgi:serine/threonine protein kinase
MLSPKVIRIIDHDNFSNLTPPTAVTFTGATNPALPFPVETELYAAPELFGAEKYHPPMDLFSFGLVMWRIIYRERPRSKLEEIADGIAPDTVHLTDNGLAPHPRAPSDHYFEFLG